MKSAKPQAAEKRASLVFIVLLALAGPAAADWPQFRGPGGRSVSADKDLPTTWGADNNVRWKVELPGRGLSAPVVAQGRVYLTACSGPDEDRLHVLCFDLATGKKLWERQFWATGTTLCHPKTSMAAPTPVTDGERVFALFATHDLVALDKNGGLLWFRSLTGDYPTVGNNVGMASSPILHGDTLLVALENAGESFALAIDKLSGQNRWKAERPRGINWVTPVLIERGGKTEVVFQSGQDVSGYEVGSGKKVWTFAGKGMATIPSPTFADGLLFVPGQRFTAVRPGDGKEAQVWESKKLPTGYASPVVHQGRVYTLSYGGVLNCADAASGKPVWDQRLEGKFAATPLLANGKLYAVNEEGATTVIDVTGPKAAIVGVNTLSETVLASPVAADGAIFLRSDRHLYCFGKKKE
jgi:outer membrane protein assembly factor BamB